MRHRPAPDLADSHVHLDRYSPPALEGLLQRARRAGVRHFLSVGVDVASSRSAAALARRRRGVFAAVGVHPQRVFGLDLERTLERLRELARQPGVVAIGEVGLDSEARVPRASQEAFFRACLRLARELGLAVVLHVVGEHERALEVLAEERPERAVVHYFQGDWALAASYLTLGCSISVGRPVTRQDRVALREAVRHIPLERLLLETDTYPLPGRTTEPKDVAEVCRAVADLRGVPWQAIAEATTANFFRFCQRYPQHA